MTVICWGSALFLYLFIGWIVAYEAHKRDWNSRLARWDQTDHRGWWLLWPWHGGMILGRKGAGWREKLRGFTENQIAALFDRMMKFEWRVKNGTED